jgi:hypothetical protein
MVFSLLLVIVTIVKGFDIDENPLFLLFESLLNIAILLDFVCRLKLLGVKRYFEGGCWNIFDLVVVISCILLFIVMLVSTSGLVLELEEVGEQILLVVWGLF